jgi:hypothetical protein
MNSFNFKGSIRNYIERKCEQKLPRRIKKLIYVSSLLAYLKDLDDSNIEVIRKLNNIFHIAAFPDTLKLPIRWKSTIWQDLNTEEVLYIHNGQSITFKQISEVILSDSDRSNIASRLFELTPNWLKYGQSDSMKKDLENILLHLKDFQKA